MALGVHEEKGLIKVHRIVFNYIDAEKGTPLESLAFDK
jgi:hypothetical protein